VSPEELQRLKDAIATAEQQGTESLQ
jgi:hypothetical protein